MCSSKTSPVVEEKQSTRKSIRIKKRKSNRESSSSSSTSTNFEASSRKMRTKTKRPKFLSLKLELNSSNEIEETTKKKQSKNNKEAKTTSFKEKVKTEDSVQEGGEKEEEQYDNVAAYLFNSTTDSTISSIHDLLPSSTTVDLDCDGRNNLSPYDHQEHGSSSSSLLRTAMRKGASKEEEEEEEEETTEERWVSYSEVVEEVMSRSGTPQWCDGECGGGDGRLSLTLKLDYEQIMEAWSDKGTLYVDGEPPQIVPDLHASSGPRGLMDGGGEAGNLWTVPEMETTERSWRGHREASLLRYKEKRQNRLFSKRIRYQVRKLNAEKRPRIKGRFVKRDDL